MNRSILKLSATALLVAAITIWLHWPGVRNGFLAWDDDLYLGDVVELKSLSWHTITWAFSTVQHNYYHPLTWLSYVLDYQWHGLAAGPFHATSVVVHGLNAGLVVVAAWMLTAAAGWSERQRWAAVAGVGLFFGLHPIQVESVAWIAERKTVLYVFFALLSVCAYVRSVSVPASGRGVDRRWWWLMTACYILSLLAKPMAMSLPAVMLAMDFYPLRRHQTVGWPGLLKEKVLLIGLAVADLAATVLGQAQASTVMSVGAHGIGDRCLVAVRAFVFYVWKLLWPAWLSPLYPLQPGASLWQKEFFVPVIAVIIITACCIGYRRRQPALLAVWVAYIALILPVSGLVQVGPQAAADRYAYFAVLPVLLLLSAGCIWLWRKLGSAGRAALVTLLGVDLLFLAVRTRDQISMWREDETVWRAVLRPFPGSCIANAQLAMALTDKWLLDDALVYAERAVQADPSFAKAQAAFGLVLLKKHRAGEAVTALEAAVSLEPGLLGARYNLACAYSRLGRFDEALTTLREVVAGEPGTIQLVARDPELAGLRNDPVYGARLKGLLTTAGGGS